MPHLPKSKVLAVVSKMAIFAQIVIYLILVKFLATGFLCVKLKKIHEISPELSFELVNYLNYQVG